MELGVWEMLGNKMVGRLLFFMGKDEGLMFFFVFFFAVLKNMTTFATRITYSVSFIGKRELARKGKR